MSSAPAQPTEQGLQSDPAPQSPAPARRGFRGALARVPTWLWVLLFYLALATVTIGWFAISHLNSVCACDGGADPAIFTWALDWWPHAIVHGLNPFFTYYQWSPTGANIAQSPEMPTAAFAMAPVTALFGPIVSYNVLSITSPALGAFTAYLLCRRLVKRELPAVVGGFLFGFSSFELGQLLGHLPLVFIFLIPVMVHLALRRVDREISRTAYVLLMALVLALQLGLSTEWLAECVMLGMVLLVIARFLAPEPQRARMNGLIGETIGAGLIAIVVCSPYLYYALISGGGQAGGNAGLSDVEGLDLANLIFPTFTTWLGHNAFLPLSIKFQGGNASETDGYLSIAMVTAFSIWFFTEGRRSVLGKLLAITIFVSIVMALGSHLHVAGIETVPLPYNLLNTLPVFNLIVPSRIALFAEFAIAIGVAAWLAKTGGHVLWRWALVLAGVIMLFPNVNATLYGAPVNNPKFFATALYRQYLTRNENVLVLPFGHNDVSTLWQAETGFYFHMPEGYVLGTIPPAFETQPGVVRMFNNLPIRARTLGAFMHDHAVSHVVVDPAKAGPWPALLHKLGLHGRRVGGVILYSVPAEKS